MFRKDNRKIISSTILFSSAPALALQASGEKNVLGKQTFLQNAPKTNNVSGYMKIFSYVGIAVVVLFLIYWYLCIDYNGKLLKNKVGWNFENAKYQLDRVVEENENAKSRKEELIKESEAKKEKLKKLQSELKRAEEYTRELEKNEVRDGYLARLQGISVKIEENIKIEDIFKWEYQILDAEKNIEKKLEELKELEFFKNLGLDFDWENLVLKVVEKNSQEKVADDFFDRSIKDEINKSIEALKNSIESDAKAMLENVSKIVLGDVVGAYYDVLCDDDSAVKKEGDDFTLVKLKSLMSIEDVDAEKTFQGNEEQKKEFKEKVDKYNKLLNEDFKNAFDYAVNCLRCICNSVQQKKYDKKLKDEAGTVDVEGFLEGALSLLNEIKCFFIKFKDEKFSSFSDKLQGRIGGFQKENYKKGEFNPKGVFFDDYELKELKEYVNKKISDFKKDRKESEAKISNLNKEKLELEKSIEEYEAELNSVKFEDLTSLKDKVAFYNKQKKKLEKDWWKPWFCKFEEYKENN